MLARTVVGVIFQFNHDSGVISQQLRPGLFRATQGREDDERQLTLGAGGRERNWSTASNQFREPARLEPAGGVELDSGTMSWLELPARLVGIESREQLDRWPVFLLLSPAIILALAVLSRPARG